MERVKEESMSLLGDPSAPASDDVLASFDPFYTPKAPKAAAAPSPPAAAAAPLPVFDDMRDVMLKDQVKAEKTGGRQAKAAKKEMESRRRDEGLDGAKDFALGAGGLTANILAPGSGTAATTALKAAGSAAASAAYGTRADVQKGKSLGSSAAKNTASAVVGATPILGDVVGMVKGGVKMAKAAGESDKSRTTRKIQQAQGVQASADTAIPQIESLSQQVKGSGHSEKDRKKMGATLDKAHRRQREALTSADSLIKRKEDKGHAPLLLTAEGGPVSAASDADSELDFEGGGYEQMDAPASDDTESLL